ncbi:MAG TPA: adenosylmethionine--8-amino-7-oxononanoate transaminase [Turneriella sp.]|nr:adenosylmethionine--8-amino-7-oxononanoate transaminase [Turneriella sp.]
MIWYPFTPQNGALNPILIQRGEREYLYDENGKAYIDAVASWWTMAHGHNHPAIMNAIREQTQKLDHVMLADFTHEGALSLAEKLLTSTKKKFTHVFYSDNGSTAVEAMLKLAVQYWSNEGHPAKNQFIKFDVNYHGDTVGAMATAAPSVFNRVFSPLLFHAPCFRYPRVGEDTLNAQMLIALEEYLEKNQEEIAALILEPLIAAAGGMVFECTDALNTIAALAQKYNVLLLFDEVFTGMGRTGEMFAYQKAGVVPDILALAKGLTGGTLPLAATLVNARVHRAFQTDDPLKTFYHGHTMTGNPIAVSAALASIQIFEKENTLQYVQALEQKMQLLCSRLTKKFPQRIKNVRVLGAVAAIDIVASGEEGYVFSYAKEIKAQAFREGVILRPLGNVLYVTPPYRISDAALEKTFLVIEEILENYAVDHPKFD